MDKNARRKEIEELIRERKELDVNEIKNRFGISSVTVRNDLIDLERKGIIQRLFGKAVLNEEKLEASFDETKIRNLTEKEKIGKYAANLIDENESILLYTGTTTLQIARFVDPSKRFIAVTNSIYITYELKRNTQNAKTVLIGGNFNPQTGATYGQEAVNQLNAYNIDKLFLAVDGIDSDYGITNDQPYETDINRAMIRKARKVIVVADYSKIGVVSFVNMGSIKEVDTLITDSRAPKDSVQRIMDKGVKVIIV